MARNKKSLLRAMAVLLLAVVSFSMGWMLANLRFSYSIHENRLLITEIKRITRDNISLDDQADALRRIPVVSEVKELNDGEGLLIRGDFRFMPVVEIIIASESAFIEIWREQASSVPK